MTTTPTPCPTCTGPSQPGHPGGLLAGWHHRPTCTLLAHEDARAVADHDLLVDRRRIVREATTTERTLLTALGWTWTGEPLLTLVNAITEGVHQRAWPDSERTPTP